MKSKINHIGEFERELDIFIPWERVKDEYDELLKHYAKFPIKGFRTGKMPLNTVEAIYKNELKNDLAMQCSTHICRKVLKEHSVLTASPVEIEEIQLEKGRGMFLKGRFTEMPNFDLPDYAQLDLHGENIDDKVNEIADKLLQQTNFNLPDLLIERELNYSFVEEDCSESDAWSATQQRVRLMVILKKIALLDSIEIDEKDIEERIKTLARENDITTEELKAYLQENGGISRFSDSLLAEEVFKYIIEIQQI